jgi:hypothetical protein
MSNFKRPSTEAKLECDEYRRDYLTVSKGEFSSDRITFAMLSSDLVVETVTVDKASAREFAEYILELTSEF